MYKFVLRQAALQMNTQCSLNQFLKEQLSLSRVKMVLKQLFTSNVDEEEAVRSPIPWALMRKFRFLTKLLHFMSDMTSEVGDKIITGKARTMKSKQSKVWSIEEIQSEVEAVVMELVSMEHSQNIDHGVGLMDIGLDSFGNVELPHALQSRFGIELPSTFVFYNPTIADMSNHLFAFFNNPEHDETSKGARNKSFETPSFLSFNLSPQVASILETYSEKIHDDSFLKIIRQLDFWYSNQNLSNEEMLLLAESMSEIATWREVSETTHSRKNIDIPEVRFGRTELQMPIISTCGGESHCMLFLYC